MLVKCQQLYQLRICFTCLHCVDCDLYKYWCSECRVGLSNWATRAYTKRRGFPCLNTKKNKIKSLNWLTIMVVSGKLRACLVSFQMWSGPTLALDSCSQLPAPLGLERIL